MKSRVISISAISASLIAVVLILGSYVEVIDLLTVVLASAFVILPLYYGSYLGCYLAYFAGSIIAFLCGGFNIMSIVVPSYLIFFGLYPIVKFKLESKNVKFYILFIVGTIWCVLSAYGIYFYYIGIMGRVFSGLPSWLNDIVVYAVGVVAIVFYFIFDRFLTVSKFAADRLLKRILK